MENVHSTRRAEQSEYTPQNTIETVHFKEATYSNLNPRIGKSMVSLVFQHLMNNFFTSELEITLFSSTTNVNKSILLINHEIIVHNQNEFDIKF